MTRDVRWLDVEDRASSAVGHFRNAVRLHEAGGFDMPDLEGYRNRMAFLHAMQSAFTCAEAALRDILDIIGEKAPTGADSHARLVDRAAMSISLPGYQRPALVPTHVADDLHEVRRFRHLAAHNYNVFQPERATSAVDAARRLSENFMISIRTFINIIDPDEYGVSYRP